MTGTSTGHPWLPLVVPVEARNVRDGVERARRQEDVLPDDDRVHCPSSAATGGSSLGAGRPGWRGARAPAGVVLPDDERVHGPSSAMTGEAVSADGWWSAHPWYRSLSPQLLLFWVLWIIVEKEKR